MLIKEPRRLEMYESLKSIHGDSVAETIIEHLPPSGWADVLMRREFHSEMVVMRSEFTSEMAALRTELHSEMAALRTELRTELHSEIGTLRTEMHSEIGALRSEMLAMELRLSDKMNDLFRWAVATNLMVTGLLMAGMTAAMKFL